MNADPGFGRSRPFSAGEIEKRLHRLFSNQGSRMTDASSLRTAPPVALHELLQQDGDAFVYAAYRAILGRDPDAHGLQHHRAAMGAGMRKVMLVGGLRYGAEGRKAGRVIPGLRPLYLMSRAEHLPVVGRAVRVLIALLTIRSTIQDLRDRLRDQERGGRQLRELLADLELRIAEFEREPWAEPIALLAERNEEQQRRTEHLGNVAALGETIQALKIELGWDETDAALARRFGRAIRAAEARVVQAEAIAESSRTELRDQQRRIGLILEELRRKQAIAPDRLEKLDAAVGDHLLDSLYVTFEDRFRGSRATIRDRQRAHLPLMRESGAGNADRPIVDVGSGRGEWLELLRDEGFVARGVDLNEAMAAACGERGLQCAAGDAVGYLAALPDASVGAVTGFHIIEHLPFRVMVALLDEALRVLQPGGVILFETPNPANVLVGSRWFYLDPTHRNPLPGEMMAMIAEARGFAGVEIRELHPMEQRFAAHDQLLAEQLDRLFHGPQDYALVARKP